MNFRSFFGFFSSDLAIDLGTANTLVYAKGRGIVVNEPSIVALDKNSKKVLAVGHAAKEMLGRTPADIIAVKPMKDGVIADFDVTEVMLKSFIKSAHSRNHLLSPRIVIGIPSEITQVEKRAVQELRLFHNPRLGGVRRYPMPRSKRKRARRMGQAFGRCMSFETGTECGIVDPPARNEALEERSASGISTGMKRQSRHFCGL